MMLEHLGHADRARAVVGAIERVVEDGKTLTRDLAAARRLRGRGRRSPRSSSARAGMNYFGHTVLAVRYGGDRAFVLGAMLPDFAAMIRARPPRVDHVDIDSGMRFHWRTDESSTGPRLRQLTRQAWTGYRRGASGAAARSQWRTSASSSCSTRPCPEIGRRSGRTWGAGGRR